MVKDHNPCEDSDGYNFLSDSLGSAWDTLLVIPINRCISHGTLPKEVIPCWPTCYLSRSQH